jgi:hypothetical protein
MTGGMEYPGRFRRLPGGIAPTPAIRVPTDEQADQLQTVLKTEIESREPEPGVPVEEDVCPARADWGEEERRNVAALFTLLDQWDRDLNKKRQVA